MRPAPVSLGLLREQRFRHLALATGLSQVGTRMSYLALPLLGLVTFHASALTVSLVLTTEMVASALWTLPAGAFCERRSARAVMVVCDASRAGTLGLLALIAWIHPASTAYLFLAALSVGSFSAFFDVAYLAYLPRIVKQSDLAEGYSKLQANYSLAGLVGPTAAGVLTGVFSPALAVLVDALTYLWSGAWLSKSEQEHQAARQTEKVAFTTQIRSGLLLVFRHPTLRRTTLAVATSSLFLAYTNGIMVAFLLRSVELSPATIGYVNSLSVLGGLAGAWYARRAINRFGFKRTLVGSLALSGIGSLLTPLTHRGILVSLYVLAGLLITFGIVIFSVAGSTLRQELCPPEYVSRMNATIRFLLWCVAPLGGVLGGTIAAALGLRTAMWIAGLGMCAATVWILDIPTGPEERIAVAPTGEEPAEPLA